MGKSVFFIGHREASSELLPILADTIETHISKYGAADFIVGSYGNFDRLAASAVIAAKKAHPHITLSLLLPYHPAERPVKTPKGFNSTYYPPGMEDIPRQYAIVRANRYVVDHVDYLIAYAWHPASNARELVEYARKREKRHLIAVTVLKPFETNTRSLRIKSQGQNEEKVEPGNVHDKKAGKSQLRRRI